MTIAIGSDHGGIVLKEAVIRAIESLGMKYVDYGTFGTESVDYPDYAEKVASAVARGEQDGRITSPADAYEFTRIFLTTPFAGGRHATRVDKIMRLEKLNG